jgi:hypothetical protein
MQQRTTDLTGLCVYPRVGWSGLHFDLLRNMMMLLRCPGLKSEFMGFR